MLLDLIGKVRPAPLQVFLYNLIGANRREVLPFRGMRFFCDPTSDLGVRISQGSYEPEMMGALEELLRPGDTFLDLGANEGLFSVLACRIVGGANVVAVEPQARLIPVIERNLELNECTGCRVVNAAITDREGTVTLHLSPTSNTGSTSVYDTAKYPLKKQEVRGIPLGTLVKESGIEKFTLLKVDIEGAEYPVLMSAGDLLRSGVFQSILVEFHERVLTKEGLRVSDIHEHLLACGYRRVREGESALYQFDRIQ